MATIRRSRRAALAVTLAAALVAVIGALVLRRRARHQRDPQALPRQQQGQRAASDAAAADADVKSVGHRGRVLADCKRLA